MSKTILQFVRQSYRLINPSNPTQTLNDDDFKLAVTILNDLMNYYASSGLMLTIAQTVNIALTPGKGLYVVGPPTFIPVPDFPYGRLANIENAWLLLDGVTYPLIDESRPEFLDSFKYEPLQGLPRFIITYPDVDIVTLQLYPAPSQYFQLYIRAKFQLPNYLPSDTTANLPDYFQRFLLFAVAKDLALYKGRAAAWTEKLEMAYREAKDVMEGASEVNTAITGARESLLNGSWRVMSGV